MGNWEDFRMSENDEVLTQRLYRLCVSAVLTVVLLIASVVAKSETAGINLVLCAGLLSAVLTVVFAIRYARARRGMVR